MREKMWGAEPFWGLSYEWDPDWVLTERQKELRETLIGLCEQEMRANAKRSDDELLYPRRNLELMGQHGFLALTVPEHYGGLGENHVAFAMTCETIARYGCASTAMCYVMHTAAVQTLMLRPTPELIESYNDLSVFVIDGEQIVGPEGDGATSNNEAVDPWFLIGSSSVWNGIALGAIDIAARHTTRKRHVDVGMRVADYPTIQDYVGEAVMDTNAARMFVFSVAQAFDKVTDHNRRVLEPGQTARADFLHWAWQIRSKAAKNVHWVLDKMLHACGGSGYKRDMELERYVRDAKAGWVMGPTNEVLRHVHR